MNELRRIFRHQLRAALCVVALGCLVPLQVAAQVEDAAFNRFRSQVIGNSVHFSYGSGGTPLGGASTATGIGVTSGVDVGRSTSINTKHGPISGTLAQKLSSGSMGKAMGRLATAGSLATPVGLAFLALPFIVEWLGQADIVADEEGQLSKEVTKQDCTVSWAGQLSHTFTRSSCIAATEAVRAHMVANNQTHSSIIAVCDASPVPTCGISWTGTFPLSTTFPVTLVGAPYVENEPISPSELEGALSSVTNPSPAALAELYKLGETINLANPIPDLVDTLRAEFEARSPESTTTETTDTPSETKTEEKVCATYTQVVANVLSLVEQCETTTTTQAKDPETGAPVGDPVTTTKTTTDGTPDSQVREDEQTAEDPCINNPNRAGCVELGTPEGEIPTDTRSVSYTPESVFGAGTCPADKSVVAYGMTLQLTNMAQACDLLNTYVKPIAILLAAFTALMIVAVGVPE